MRSEDFEELSNAQQSQHIFNNTDDNFPNLYKIISFLLSIPAASSFAERVFSVMNSERRD